MKKTFKIELSTLGQDYEVTVNGAPTPIKLTNQQFALLVYIVHQSGKSKRDDLVNKIFENPDNFTKNFSELKKKTKESLGVTKEVFKPHRGKDDIELADDFIVTTDALELEAVCKTFDLQRIRSLSKHEEPSLLFLESLNKKKSPNIEFRKNFKEDFKKFVENQREVLNDAVWNVYLHHVHKEPDKVDQLLEEALLKTGGLPPPTKKNGSYKRLRYLHFKYKASLESHSVTEAISEIDKELGDHGYADLSTKEIDDYLAKKQKEDEKKINDYLAKKQKEDKLVKLKAPDTSTKKPEETTTEAVPETKEESNSSPIPKADTSSGKPTLTQRFRKGLSKFSFWISKKWWLAILLVSFLLILPFLLQGVVYNEGSGKCKFNSRQTVKQNADWTPVECSFSGAMMVLVPKGSFIMGSNSGEDDEVPTIRQKFSSPFWIDKTEVTREKYAVCVLEGGCTGAKDSEYSTAANQPMNRVTWHQAATYCKWRRARLPTEAEWEYAARGPNSFVFPWGNEFDENKVHYAQTSNNQTAPVGSYPDGASWVGALDMSGNGLDLCIEATHIKQMVENLPEMKRA